MSAADYWFGADSRGEGNMARLVSKYRRSQRALSHVPERAGPHKHVASQARTGMQSIGYGKVFCKTDTEPALTALVSEVASRRLQPTVAEHPPRYPSQSNGSIERGIQSV